MKKQFIFILAIIPFLMMGFQNCSLQRPGTMNLDTNNSLQTGGSSAIPAPLAGNSIEAQAITLLQNKCYACHGTVASGGVTQINNPSYLIAHNFIIPGNPDGSPIFSAVVAKRMPIGSNALSTAELDILRNWIVAGAKAPADSVPVNPPPQIPLKGTYASIQANILTPKCIHCHSGSQAKDGIRLDSYSNVKRYVSSPFASETKLYEVTYSGEMPPRPEVDLNSSELKALRDWITAGAPNN